jgi:repressor LexA
MTFIKDKIKPNKSLKLADKEELLNTVKMLCKNGYYLLEVCGDSMSEKGILHGDKIICKYQTTALDGDIVVAMIDKKRITLKTIHYKFNNLILLSPANPRFKSKLYTTDRISIQGVFVGLVRAPF